MKNRLKFRFWHKPTNKMVDCYGFNEDFVFGNTLDGIGTDYNPAKFEDCILMQSTGLKDKNGKLIYEGDIVKSTYHNPFEKHIGVIQYHTCYFSLDYKSIRKYGEAGRSLTKDTSDYIDIEVIGNRYENPELLEINNEEINN